jgi:hypothetical protein
VGKSRLTHAAFEALQSAFPDGRWWVDLDDLTEVGRVGWRVVDVLAIEISGGADPEPLIFARLRDRRALLVLDNTEHLDGLGAWVERLCAACPRLKILNTSRTRLSLAGEWVQRIEGLPVPDADETELDALQSFDAVKLFDLCARRAMSSFALTAHAIEVAQLVRVIEGTQFRTFVADAGTRGAPCAFRAYRTTRIVHAPGGRAYRGRVAAASRCAPRQVAGASRRQRALFSACADRPQTASPPLGDVLSTRRWSILKGVAGGLIGRLLRL